MLKNLETLDILLNSSSKYSKETKIFSSFENDFMSFNSKREKIELENLIEEKTKKLENQMTELTVFKEIEEKSNKINSMIKEISYKNYLISQKCDNLERIIYSYVSIENPFIGLQQRNFDKFSTVVFFMNIFFDIFVMIEIINFLMN